MVVIIVHEIVWDLGMLQEDHQDIHLDQIAMKDPQETAGHHQGRAEHLNGTHIILHDLLAEVEVWMEAKSEVAPHPRQEVAVQVKTEVDQLVEVVVGHKPQTEVVVIVQWKAALLVKIEVEHLVKNEVEHQVQSQVEHQVQNLYDRALLKVASGQKGLIWQESQVDVIVY